MKISAKRLTAILILAAQWVSVTSMIHAGNIGVWFFRGFGSALPDATDAALCMISAASLIPVASLTTIIVFAAECYFKSERPRFVIQIVNLCLWLVFIAFVMAAFMLPLIYQGTNLH
jgi:hypothetical protein